MNTSADADCAAIILSESGILPRLQQLADGRIREPTGPGGLRVDGAAINTAPPNEDEVQVAHFARYALTNMREAIVHHQAQKLYNKRVRNLAATEIQAHARRRYAQRRAREIKQMRDDAKANSEIEAKPVPAFRSRAPSFRREEFRRERATEPEPAPLLLERFFATPVAAAPKE